MQINGFLGIKGKKLSTKVLIPLEEAMKYEKDEKYKNYIFPTVGIKNGIVMCKPQLKSKIEKVEKPKKKTQKIKEKEKQKQQNKQVKDKIETKEPRKYGDWQSNVKPKNYKKYE